MAPKSAVTTTKEEDSPPNSKQPLNLTVDQLKRFEGNYWSDELQIAYRLALENGALVLRVRNLPPRKLTAAQDNEFQISDLGVSLKMTASGDAITGFVLDAGRTRGMRFEKRP